MQKGKEKQVKIYKGVFISNQRRKRAGGRIKCQEFKNKIQVMGKNQAIHQSEVEWTQVRRYKRQKKPNRNQPKKDRNIKQNEKNKNKDVVKSEKQAKYNQKQQTKVESKSKQKDNKQVDLKHKNESLSENDAIKYDKNNKKKKFKIKQESIKAQQNVLNTQVEKKENQVQTKQPKKVDNPKLQDQSDKAEQRQTSVSKDLNEREIQQQKRVQGGQNDNQSDQSSEQEQQLQVIVARIKKQTNIKFKTKPFVGILYFEKRKNFRNKKDVLENPIEQIMSDYYADLKPIHARLPIMQLDDLNVQNYKILYEYADKMVKYDKNINKKKYLNKILDQLSSVYILMTFSQWDGDIPLANIHKIIGKAMTIDGQCQRFLYQHGLNDFHYDQIPSQQIPLSPTPKHRLVEQMVFTIDPPTSTDLDDALSIQKISQSVFQVGIHIADVTSYLHLINRQEIARRTTSVYLPYKVFHMLNRNLVKVCSLDPGVQRLAFTVWVTMDLEGNIIGQSVIQKNIIKSRFKLSYGVVQDLISGNMTYIQFNQQYPCTQTEYEALLEKLLFMVDISIAHRNKRIIFDVFQNRQMEFKLDQKRWPVQCYVDKRYTSKKLVEEFMIIGNIEAAKFAIKVYPNQALVIHHPKPSKLSVNLFNDQFKSLQSKFKFENVLDVQRQLLKVDENTSIQQQTKSILFFKARRAMEPAIYRTYGQIIEQIKKQRQSEKQLKQKEKEVAKKKEADEFPVIHFALGLQFYTHFTSPMRRMADIVVHETLTQIITGQEVKSISSEQIQKINNGRRSTKRLKKDLNEVYLCLMIHHTKKSIECEGIISSFGLQSVSIFIPLFDMQKQVLWKSEFKIHSIKRIRNRQNELDVKLYHDPKTAKKDVYWVIKRFQKVELTLSCTVNPPLKLTIKMKVQSEKGSYEIIWNEEQ